MVVSISTIMKWRPATENSLALCGQIGDMFERHAGSLAESNIAPEHLNAASVSYRQLERFWISMLNFNLRGTIL